MALYRKFRPQEFADVKGQEHIVTTLKNQIKADRIGHAYLFCGTRGTGKTTIAKIFAKAVNCEHPVDGSPCGECASCKAIAPEIIPLTSRKNRNRYLMGFRGCQYKNDIGRRLFQGLQQCVKGSDGEHFIWDRS